MAAVASPEALAPMMRVSVSAGMRVRLAVAVAAAVPRGARSTAPARKQTAPSTVPALAHHSLSSSPLEATVKAPIADRPKNTDPTRFSAPIIQDLSRAWPCRRRRTSGANAIALDTRKATDPSASGRQTAWADTSA